MTYQFLGGQFNHDRARGAFTSSVSRLRIAPIARPVLSHELLVYKRGHDATRGRRRPAIKCHAGETVQRVGTVTHSGLPIMDGDIVRRGLTARYPRIAIKLQWPI
ncbi:hypothetical protein EVAR_74653_1 [Eumeta japonica]|uniref:Uncharacterized protein n=1 Tax=Eumeta variegata TaxID=151549 RepID=A0A4C1W9T7_EUMVA|nr:hypothetical protein EVAR_74653_1 [Eumeta japonica]